MNVEEEMARIRARLEEMEGTLAARPNKMVEALPQRVVENAFKDGKLRHGMLAPDGVGRLFLAIADPQDELHLNFPMPTRRRI